MIVTLSPITPVGLTPGSIDWNKVSGGRTDACEVKVANYSANGLLIVIAGNQHWLEPWMANKFPAQCANFLQYEQVAISSVAALPAGATPSILVTVSFEEELPGIYPVPLYGTLPIDTNAADVQALDFAAKAGSIGLGADSGHVHPTDYADIRNFGASTTIADNGPAINAAIVAVGKGRILIPPGIWPYTTTINADQTTGIRLIGVGTPTAGAAPGSVLRYDGAGARGISARSSVGFGLARLGLFYTNNLFVGSLVDCSHVIAADSSLLAFRDCLFAGSGITTAQILLLLDQCETAAVCGCAFTNAGWGIMGPQAQGSYAVAAHIYGECQFTNLRTAGILPGQAWLIEGNVFENLVGGAAGAISTGGITGACLGTVIRGNWMGDITNGGFQINVHALGLEISGNLIGGDANSVGANIQTNSGGIDIAGNRFATHSIAIQFGAGIGACKVGPNNFTGVTTKYSGLPASAVVVEDNGLGIGTGVIAAASGVHALGVGTFDGGVGLDTVGHNHGHTHGAHHHTHQHNAQYTVSNTGAASAGTAHTHTYNDPSAGGTVGALTIADSTDTIPANDATGESAQHTHKG